MDAARNTSGHDGPKSIGEVASELDVPSHVLRFWETRFPEVMPLKKGGNRRLYRPADVALLRGIRRLLYAEGLTVKGVQKVLADQGPEFVRSVGLATEPLGEELLFAVRGEAKEAAPEGFTGLLPSHAEALTHPGSEARARLSAALAALQDLKARLAAAREEAARHFHGKEGR